VTAETTQRTSRTWEELHAHIECLVEDECPYDLALEHLGMTHSGLRSALRRHGLPMPAAWKRKSGPLPVRWEALHEDADWLARTGCTIERAAERLGISRDSLITAYRRHGVPLPQVWRVER